MNREQKQALAQLVIFQVANIFEDGLVIDSYAPELNEVDPIELKRTVGAWMIRAKLPGDPWDTRFDC